MPNEKDHLTPETVEELLAAICDYAIAVRGTATAEAALREVVSQDRPCMAGAANTAAEHARFAAENEAWRRSALLNLIHRIN